MFGPLSLVVIAISTLAAHAEGQLVDRIEASVNSSLILNSDLATFRRTVNLRAQLDPLFAGTPLAKAGAQASDAQITEFLVSERLILNQFPVSDQDTDQEINSILASNNAQKPALVQSLDAQGYRYDDYYELIRVSASKRNLIDREIRTRVAMADADLRNYYENNYKKDASNQRKTYKIQMITLPKKNFKSVAVARSFAESLRKKVLNKEETFDAVSKQAVEGGGAQPAEALPELSEEQLSPTLKQATRGLKSKEIGPVVETKDAFLLVELDETRTADDARFEQLKEEIRMKLASAEYQRQVQLWIERTRGTSFVHFAGSDPVKGLPTR